MVSPAPPCSAHAFGYLKDDFQDKVDIVVVHRLDRLKRSVLDMTTMSPLLTVKGVEFINGYEPTMNTSTYIRLVSVQILTSSVQFERKIICERTRDKLAAT